jgi:hypothetical protein
VEKVFEVAAADNAEGVGSLEDIAGGVDKKFACSIMDSLFRLRTGGGAQGSLSV